MIEDGGLRIAIFYPRSSIFEYQNLITVAPQTHAEGVYTAIDLGFAQIRLIDRLPV